MYDLYEMAMEPAAGGKAVSCTMSVCGSGVDGYPDVQESVTRKIRKPHKCAECRDVFQPGTQMEYFTSLYDGAWGHWYTCLECLEITAEFSAPGLEDTPQIGEFWRHFEFADLTAACYGRLKTDAAREKLRVMWWKWRKRRGARCRDSVQIVTP